MPKVTGKNSKKDQWAQFDDVFVKVVPQVFSVLGDENNFISLYIKVNSDSTFMAVLKRYGPDGGPMVCFGVGYGITACLMGLEGSVAANKWRVDKPYGK